MWPFNKKKQPIKPIVKKLLSAHDMNKEVIYWKEGDKIEIKRSFGWDEIGNLIKVLENGVFYADTFLDGKQKYHLNRATFRSKNYEQYKIENEIENTDNEYMEFCKAFLTEYKKQTENDKVKIMKN